ncbi:hypothetical protein [Flindersiella endophytica]
MSDPVERLRAQYGDRLIGLTGAEVEQVRAAQGVERLPAAYERFLRTAGRSGHALLVGTDAFYPVLLEIPAWTRELLEENHVAELLPPDAVTIALHQGYHASWLTTWREDDPPVVEYGEQQPFPAAGWPTFSAYLSDQLDRAIVAVERFGEWWHGSGPASA